MNPTRSWVVLFALMGVCATASAASPVGGTLAREVLAADSLRTHTLSLLARGQVGEAIDYWALTTGRNAPSWLLALRTSFDANKQVAGACQGVARSIYAAFSQLEGEPEFVELTTQSPRYPMIVFRLASGRDVNVSLNGYHVLVRMQGRAYDAFTGSMGMPWSEYLGRLGSRTELTEKVVETVAGTP